MKRVIYILFLIFTLNGFGQNLVPNGNFETFSTCPTSFGQIDSANFWMSPTTNITGTPDYYNQCTNYSGIHVPNNWGGYQQAHSGVAYAGITLRQFNNFREYIEVPLTNTLAKICYHFEMYVNLANKCNSTTNNIGVYFSDTAITGINNSLPLLFIPQINNTTGFITDTLNWTLISGNYTALGSENFLIIGNFKDDTNSQFLTVNPIGQDITYFYIDDVSLTLCPNGINVITNKSNITIYPNPANNYITITSENNEAIKQIAISDLTGRLVFKKNYENKIFETNTNLSFLPASTYFISISTANNIYNTKFVIIK